ncbi:MAG: phenylalanine--tRNA ligase subunit beta [Gammaproteobacteria bacterium]|nr:phenylalanine--tRNA ligase subunit beta [Gammaproteobacteria bacterium]MBU1927051.1 phenylalanine--tRNA ligase subunit beta [Gammaproteobacteria bacterium]MBU2545864.1 phenylalanine--tRNA ligase subunit beta [Gammaproteobacteria bacterium]
MKFSEQWLKEWVLTDCSIDAFAHQLTMLGLEVDSVSKVANAFDRVVIGKVVTATQHPNADRLKVCTVDVNQPEFLTIVCGAPNVHDNMKVAVALVGARLSPEFVIKQAKLRGVESSGMLCSEKELGLADLANGIMELPEDAPVGQDFRDFLKLDDVSIDIELTPNRGDCASMKGIAREVATIYRLPLHQPDWKAVKPTISDTFPVQLNAGESAPRYVGRVIRDVNIQAKTPLWMQEKLRRAGLHSIHPIVDVTNYVMLELGQPMHAFDFDQLQGRIEVRFAKEKEELVLLNDETVALNSKTLVIADSKRALAMAGVMGGKASSITNETRHIFLESAYFNPTNIAGIAREYGCSTDSSYRFERGVDPEVQTHAMERATQLLLDIVEGSAGPVIEEKLEQYVPKPSSIAFRPERAVKLLGVAIEPKEMWEIFERLGMKIKGTVHAECWEVSAPSFRFDISLEEDLIEEIARIHGYDSIPEAAHPIALDCPSDLFKTDQINQLRHLMAHRGYHEVVTYSFIDPKDQHAFDPNEKAIALSNPIAANMAVMRTSMLPGLVNTLIFNINRQQERVRIFEQGNCFVSHNDQYEQKHVMAGLIYGSVDPEQWGEANKWCDFFDLKSDVEAVLSQYFQLDDFTFTPAKHAALHPGKSANILNKAGECVGVMGALHPFLMEKYDIKKEVYLFEINLNFLEACEKFTFHAISKFPSVRRDIAIIVDQHVTAQEIADVVKQEAGDSLVDYFIFDIYYGDKIENGKKSIAIGLILQHISRTLLDAEIKKIMDRLIKKLEMHFEATLRN